MFNVEIAEEMACGIRPTSLGDPDRNLEQHQEVDYTPEDIGSLLQRVKKMEKAIVILSRQVENLSFK